MPKYKLQNFGGVNKAESIRGNINFLESALNFDTNLENGEMVSRKGYAANTDVTIDSLDVVHAYRDAEWGKDVLLAYEKDATTSNRRLWLFTQTLGAGGTYSKVSEHYYGSLEFGDTLSFLQHRNTVRIGTGTGAANKALFAGYIDRTGVNGMFDNSNFDNAAFYLLKQQWVEQPDMMNGLTKVVWDSVNSVYYCLTFRGVEIRDTDWRVTGILNDVTSWALDDTTDTPTIVGDLDITTTRLIAMGKVPNSTNTGIFVYDLLNDYSVVVSTTKSSPEFFHHCALEGSTLWVTYDDGTDGQIAETGIVSPMIITDRYGTGVGDQNYFGIDTDGTYVYVMDNDNQQIIRMEDSGSYTTSTLATGIASSYTHYGIYHSSGTLYWVVATDSDSLVYSTATSTFNSKAAVDVLDGTSTLGVSCAGIGIVNSVPMVFSPQGVIKKYDGSWADDGFIPGKIFINAVWEDGSSHSSDKTYFYGVSFTDLYGQESHLMKGAAIKADIADKIKLKVYFNAESELYQELTSPSQDPGDDPSIWGEYRRIKKINIWRAESSTVDAKEPNTDYLYLDSIVIDSPKWTLLNPSASNILNAYYTYVDDISEIGTVTFEEFSGVSQDFKPYYTNWQYGIEQFGNYYYGNVYTDAAYEQQFIKSPANAPDMNWQTAENIELFYPDDGDEIKGFGEAWSRLIVFKGESSALYNGLFREKVFNIGLQSPKSILSHNNIVYFQSNDGFYAMTPSGYERISLPVDQALASETLGTVSVVLFNKKFKVWFLVPGSYSYCYNLNTQTWDMYDLNNATLAADHDYITNGLDGNILTCCDNGNVYLQDSTFQDAGNDIEISFQTKEILTGDELNSEDHDEVFMSYDSQSTFTLSFVQVNDNGETTYSLTSMPAQSRMMTERRFVSSYGQSGYFTLSTTTSTKLFRVNSLGLTTIPKSDIQAA